MTLLGAWIGVPLALAALAAGCGALAARVSGVRLPGPLVVPVGLSVIVVVAGLLTMSDATAELAVPAVLGLAAASALLACLRERNTDVEGHRWRSAAPPVVAAVAAFAAYGAPVILSGEATFAGYVKLDDTATWLAQTDHVMERGRSLEGLAPSSYEATLASYVGDGYPLGAILPLGLGAAVSGVDVAWIFQPYLAVLASVLALALWTLLEGVVEGRWLRALSAAIAAQPALLFGYGLWGGVKELAAAAMLATLAALVPVTLAALRPQGRLAWRPLGCLAVACAGLLAVLSFGALAWLGPALLMSIPAAISRLGRGGALRAGAALAALALALAAPSLARLDVFIRPVTAILTSESEFGNLAAALSPLQVLGVWLSGDFRFPPPDAGPTYALLLVVAGAAVAGIVMAVRRRALGLGLYAVAAGLGAGGLLVVGSPWVEGKALATASPAFVLAAMAAACALAEKGRRVEGVVVGLAVSGGVLASNALAYHEVWLAPRGSLVELEAIGERINGEGPTLMTSFEPFGVRHFLRAGDPEGVSELRRRIVALRDGSTVRTGDAADVDRIRLPDLLTYRTLVLRRSPLASRPPSVYRLVSRRRHWETWQRPEPLRVAMREHLPLGRGRQPASTAPCEQVRRLAGVAGERGSLAAATRPAAIVVPVDGREGGSTRVSVPVAARWTVWLAGSFKPRADVFVAGRRVGTLRHRIDHAGSIWPVGAATLPRGPVAVALRFGEPDWRPGSGGVGLGSGPLVLGREPSDGLMVVPSREWKRLCGRRLDWIEAVP